ncbi:DUF3237 family protein [Arsenicicoccus piscis]|uniref:Uncharacterized protein n=1 Tax=Arsenicicoccus piscis TaxID=673954 RepID=A0ABQ6HRX1_9MICO|nr:DUF3237 family protein [Arsenicicoccus piscis]MCH8626575.1 DUF3237 family protein [Arsenicicoccus piscis]GMA21223.1 hypothetical protein GCM10025862_32440 [Arsenicicoccus piscis]
MRRVVPIRGGQVHGTGVSGRVLAGGADFQLLVADTAAHLEARYLIDLDDGTRLYVDNRAIRSASPEDSAALARGEAVDPDRVYFRCAPRLAAAVDGPWAWVHERIFVGVGRRAPRGVTIEFFVVE